MEPVRSSIVLSMLTHTDMGITNFNMRGTWALVADLFDDVGSY